MSNEKLNNWRGKLEEADALPGEPVFDKAAAWDKLQGRLGYEPRHKKTVWYWVAAAAIVLLMGWPLLLKKTDTMLPVNGIVQKKQPDKPVSLEVPVKEPADRIIISHPVVKQPVREKLTTGKKHPVTNNIPATTLTRVDPVDIPSPALPDATVDSAAATMTAAKTAKKLPVVHINELETPAPQLAVSPPPGHSRFRIKLSNHQPNQQLAASQKNHDGLINVKISFKN